MTKAFQNILQTVGNTPIVRIGKLAPEGVELYVKLEAFNPMSSVKDRLALGIIEAAEADGSLKPGQTVVEATSGNTGIGLAMVCAAKGYPLVVTMAESFSVERRKLMRFLGAKVILTPASEKGSGMIAKARELAEKHGWFLARQFENEAGPDIHSRTTAQEILDTFDDAPLDYWVSGFGTGGTLKGVARRLKAESPGTKIVAAEPDNSALIASGFCQPYNEDGSPAASHPAFRPHLMQGWTPDFVPKLVNDVLQDEWIDELQPVAGADAMTCAKDLARYEGILCGTSGGATFAAALEVARRAPKGSRILAMLPDTGERYLSTPLFAEIEEVMNAEELDIAASTPRFRFDAGASAPAPQAAPVAASEEAKAELEALISDPEQPVVFFALEWCEFCWSVRKLFAAAGIAYHSVDLDGAAYREDDRGGALRRALAEKTGAVTIPQIFVGGQHVGGATETFDAFNSGALQEMLTAVGREVHAEGIGNAYGFLPAWLHPRKPATA
ncbi:cysteine synthase A [Alloyangia pacifica]|uniref:Cysteine synthase B n=1 Tax=Alloyangia pacifica TaxID=311180 RepID=A0A1I6VY17_9RHOB|nr:cysteine synthase A [Alloyangia pacifica]SFT18617.1 cysteine synthase A [Alloyangia pacifica]